MQVAEVKTSSSASPNVQAKRQPFFSKDGQDSFFSKSNETTSSFFSPATIQPKLTIGQPNDKYEVEADAMADKVVQRLSANPSTNDSPLGGGLGGVLQANNLPAVQAKCSHCEEEEKLQKKEDEVSNEDSEIRLKPIFESNVERPGSDIQTKPLTAPSIQGKCSNCEQEEKLQKKEEEELPDSEMSLQRKAAYLPSENSPDLESRLNSSKGGGSSLPSELQISMGSEFGADFSNVRIHTGAEAVRMNKDLGAQAFTHGNDIYFNQGKYDASSSNGQHLLAHELTHTVQQGGAKVKRKRNQVSDSTSLNSIPVIQLSQDNSIIGRVGSFFGGVTRTISNTASNVASAVGNTASNVGATLSDLGGQIFDSIRSLISSGLESIQAGWNSFQSFASNVSNQLLDNESTILDQLNSPFQAIMNAIRNFSAEGVSNDWVRVKALANTLFNFTTNLISSSLSNVTLAWQTLGSIIDGIWNRVQTLRNRAIQTLGSSINSAIASIFEPLLRLISLVRRAKERIDQMILEAIRYIRENVLHSLNELINYSLDNFIQGFSNAVAYYRALRQLVEQGDQILYPMAAKIAEKVEPAPSKVNETLHQKFQEPPGYNATSESNAPQIQLQPDTIIQTRSMTTGPEFMIGMEVAITQIFGEANPLEIILEALLSMFHPWDYWSEDWGNFTTEWEEGWNRFYVPRGIHDLLTNLSHFINLLVVFVRFILAVVGRWYLFIWLGMMLGLAILGGLVGGGILGTGGTIVGTLLPGIGNAIGGAVGTGAGVLAGAGFGAGIGFSAGLAFGEALLIAYIVTEFVCALQATANLFLLLTQNQKLANLVRLVSCLFGFVVASLLTALSVIGKAVAQKFAAVLGNIARRVLGETFAEGFNLGARQGPRGPISRFLNRRAAVRRIGDYPDGVGEIAIDDLQPIHDVPRAGTPEGHINSIADQIRANGYDVTKPVSATQLPDGTLLVTGGHHRIAAMQLLGETSVPTRIFPHSGSTPYNLGRFVGIGRTTGKYQGDYVPDMPDDVRISVNDYLDAWRANNPEQVKNVFNY